MNLKNEKQNSLSAAGQTGLSGCVLKMIAVFSMLVDHTAASVFGRLIVQMPAWGPVTSENRRSFLMLYSCLRLIGRMAFPIYCFLLVEGFYHTRNRAKYALRLFVFALISEIPFDMALRQSLFDSSHNNVFFTLLIGLISMWGIHVVQTYEREKEWIILRILFILVIVFYGCIVAELLHTDYGAAGVIAILLMYLFYEKRELGFGLMVLSLGFLSDVSEFGALFMLPFIDAYNGTRGRQMKYFFYWFYPVHLLILGVICMLLGLGI